MQITYYLILSGLFILTILKPPVGIVSVLIMFSLEQWGQSVIPMLLTYSSITNYAIAFIVLSGYLSKKLFFKSIPQNRNNSIKFYTFFLYIYACITVVWSQNIELGTSKWISQGPYLLLILGLAPLLVQRTKDFFVIFDYLILFSTPLLFLLAFYVEWDGRRILLNSSYGVYGNPLEISTLAGIILLVSIFHMPTLFRKYWSVIKYVVIGLCVYVLALSGSRGQMIGALLVPMILWPLRYSTNKIGSYILLIIMASFLIFIAGSFINDIWSDSSRWSKDENTEVVMDRFRASIMLLKIWVEDPFAIIAGLGNGSSYDLIGFYPHNVPVEILAEEGIIGFCIYLIILILVYKKIRWLLKMSSKDKERRTVVVIIMSILLFYLLLSLKQGSLLGNMVFFMMVILVGKMEAMKRTKKMLTT